MGGMVPVNPSPLRTNAVVRLSERRTLPVLPVAAGLVFASPPRAVERVVLVIGKVGRAQVPARTDLLNDAARIGAVPRRPGPRSSGTRGPEHPLPELVFAHASDPEPLRAGGRPPDQLHPLPCDSERLRQELQEPFIRLPSFRGRAHVHAKRPVVESADALAGGSGLDPNLHVEIARAGGVVHDDGIRIRIETRLLESDTAPPRRSSRRGRRPG